MPELDMEQVSEVTNRVTTF